MPYKKKNGIFTPILISILVAVSVSILIIALESTVLMFFLSPMQIIMPLTVVFTLISYFVSGLLSDKITGMGAVGGLIASTFIAVLSFILSLILKNSAFSFPLSVILRLVCVILGTLGAFISSKSKRKTSSQNRYRKIMARR